MLLYVTLFEVVCNATVAVGRSTDWSICSFDAI